MQLTPEIFAKIKAGDIETRDQVFQANMGLIWACVKKYSGLLEKEDLFQLGAMGMLKAIQRFDPSYGVSFSTYAVPLILGEIRRYLRDTNPVKVSRKLKELYFEARKYSDMKKKETGREPPVEEIALELGVEVDLLCMAIDACSPALYLEDLTCLVPPLSASASDKAHPSFQSIELKDALERLKPELKAVVEARFFRGKTQMEIAAEMGISQAHVCRMEKRGLLELRSILAQNS